MHKYRQLAKEHAEKWTLYLNYGEMAEKFDADEWYEALAALEEANKKVKEKSEG